MATLESRSVLRVPRALLKGLNLSEGAIRFFLVENFDGPLLTVGILFSVMSPRSCPVPCTPAGWLQRELPQCVPGLAGLRSGVARGGRGVGMCSSSYPSHEGLFLVSGSKFS